MVGEGGEEMRFFLKNRKLQVARIALLLGAGIIIVAGIWIAFSLKVISTLPIWILIALTIGVVVYALRMDEGGDA